METATSHTELYPIAQIDIIEAALAARLGKDAPYIPAAEKFYHSRYGLDGCVAADHLTDHGYFLRSAKQLNSFRLNQRDSGFYPGVSHPPKRFSWNPERWLSTQPFDGNDYIQSPVWAHSVLKLYDAASSRPAVSPEQAIDADAFLRDICPDVLRFYLYIVNNLQVSSSDHRAFLLHPHMANRDSSPEYDDWKRDELERQLGRFALLLERKSRTGEHMPTWFNTYNRVADYAGAIAINLAGYKAGWEPARIHETTEFIDV